MTQPEQNYFSDELWAVGLFGKTFNAKEDGAEEGDGTRLSIYRAVVRRRLDYVAVITPYPSLPRSTPLR